MDDDDDDDDDHTLLALVHDGTAISLRSLPLPVPRNPDEHLVQVHAVALTAGELAWSAPRSSAPAIPGYEVSGTVVLAPPASPFQPGTDIYACTALSRPGSAREYTLARTDEMGQKPENLCWEEAATVPLSALTAWQALFVHGRLAAPPPAQVRSIPDNANAGKRVLVTGAAGGVGLWAVQLARLAGVGHITAVCSAANIEFVRSLGAHRVVLYDGMDTEDPGEAARDAVGEHKRLALPNDKYDVVLDSVGGEILRRVWTNARHGGTIISVTVPADRFRPEAGVGMDVHSAWFAVQPNSEQLQAITDLVEADLARAFFDSAFPLDQHEAAIARVESRGRRGKVVLRL